MKHKRSSRGNFKNLALLSPLVFLFALSLDIYAPAIPLLRTALHTTSGTIQLTVSCFVAAMGIGQLILGPLSDRYGRKPVILAGLAIYTLGSLLCSLSGTTLSLITGRIFQAIGCACTMSSAFASVRDMYQEHAAPVFSILNASIAIVPLIAPVLGGYLVMLLGWKACFFFLFGFGILIFLFTFFGFQEPMTKTDKTIKAEEKNNNLKILFHPTFLSYTLSSTCGYTCFLAFLSVTPYILITLLHIPIQHFGYYFASISVIVFFGSLACSFLIRKYTTSKVNLWGAISVLVSSFLMALLYMWEGLTIAGYLLPIVFMGIGGCFLMGAGAGGAITPFENAGFASSILGCIQFILSAIAITLLMIWPVKSPVPLIFLIAILGFISTSLSLYIVRKST